MSDGHMSPASAGARTRVGRPLLTLALASMMDEVHAHSGAVYLMAADEPVLEMAVMAGLPRAFAAPWERVGLSAPIPVAEAARERRLVWVGGEHEMARRYPRIAVVLPYPFALAAVPVATAAKVYGAVFVTWPGSHPPDLSDRERDHLTAACGRLAVRLERAVEDSVSPHTEPDLLAAAHVGSPAGTLGTVEAARMVARLPYGLCSLDLHGRISFANDAAAELIGVPVSRLLGSQLWAAVPWLNDPVYEDRYRGALLSQHSTSFVALRPPGDWLSFRLYPSTTGLSVRVSRARAVTEMNRAGPRPGDAPARLVTISQVLSLAGALTEAVGVQDVVQLVADEIAPAVGSQALVVLGSRAGRLHVLGHRGYPDARVVERFDGLPLSETTPGTHALTTGVPAFFDSREQLERLYPMRHATPDGFAAWAYLPLIASGRPVGTCVLAYAERHPFPADERAVLTSLGGLIAQALERAVLYDAKHQLAHGLQAALLPHTLPTLPGIDAAARYLPAHPGHGHRRRLLRPGAGGRARGRRDRGRAGPQRDGGRADGAAPDGGTGVHDRRSDAGGGHALDQPAAHRPRRRALRELSVSAARPGAGAGGHGPGRASAAAAAPAGRPGAGAGPGRGPAAGHRRLGRLPDDGGRSRARFRPRPLHGRSDRVPGRRHRGRARRAGTATGRGR
ncbi:GAF domain-containing protein [Streptomyces sp. SAI-124]